MKKILIVDTKAGNLFSLKAAIERLGFSVDICQKPNQEFYHAIVIPGQGRFAAVMNSIKTNQWQNYLNNAANESKIILGICVGMQIFFESSEEDPGVNGLAWLKGRAQALDFPKKPMVGWAKLNSELWPENIVYFVNGYAIKDSEFSVAKTAYGEEFCAAVKKGSFVGVQFHPEKSSVVGSNIIRQVLSGDLNV